MHGVGFVVSNAREDQCNKLMQLLLGAALQLKIGRKNTFTSTRVSSWRTSTNNRSNWRAPPKKTASWRDQHRTVICFCTH